LLWFLSQTDKFKDPRILDAIEHIKKKRYQNDKWKVDYVYKAEGYTTFDGRSKDGEWITYLLNTVLKKHAA